MTHKAQKAIHIKWVRSGIGFTRHQKKMVRSLGLLRLNQVVERPDTPQIRGLVENIPHLVQVVSAPAKPAWMSVPEYAIFPPEASTAAVAPREKAEPAEENAVATVEAEESVVKRSEAEAERAAAQAERAVKHSAPQKPAKAVAGKAKPAKVGEAKKTKAAKSSKPAKKTKK